jgi:hypothetical protein
MVRFDQTGNIMWSVGDSPQIATADGGVIGISGTTYDSNGHATGQTSLPIQSMTAPSSAMHNNNFQPLVEGVQWRKFIISKSYVLNSNSFSRNNPKP